MIPPPQQWTPTKLLIFVQDLERRGLNTPTALKQLCNELGIEIDQANCVNLDGAAIFGEQETSILLNANLDRSEQEKTLAHEWAHTIGIFDHRLAESFAAEITWASLADQRELFLDSLKNHGGEQWDLLLYPIVKRLLDLNWYNQHLVDPRKKESVNREGDGILFVTLFAGLLMLGLHLTTKYQTKGH